MPAVSVLEIEKVYQGEYWVNRYFLSQSIGDGASTAAQILQVERNIHMSQITFTKMSLRTVAKGDFQYATTPLNLPGLGTLGTTANTVPLFVTLRVDLGTAGGRPSRKYYRGVLYEGVVNTVTVENDFVTSMNTALAPLAGLAGFCDPQGQPIVNVAVSPLVGMRQLRRGSKKKNTPSSGGIAV